MFAELDGRLIPHARFLDLPVGALINFTIAAMYEGADAKGRDDVAKWLEIGKYRPKPALAADGTPAPKRERVTMDDSRIPERLRRLAREGKMPAWWDPDVDYVQE